MGVYIFMDILPNAIDREEWERVYEESLELINAYPFLGVSIDRETYGAYWRYVHRAKETEMEFEYNELQLGWHVIGDYTTMLTAESFILVRDIESYRKRTRINEGSEDILAERINWKVFYDQEEQQIPVGSITVFDGKTQGYPHHPYLLAIACLFESRFPKKVIVHGDISVGQMKKAISWANTILTNPIQLTERADDDKLLRRIRHIISDEHTALKSFMELSMYAENFALGEFVRKQFTPEVITTYYTKQFKQYDVNMMGFHSFLRSFFNLGFSIEKACDICVLHPNGCQYDAQDFADTVLSMKWSSEKKSVNNKISLSFNDPDSDAPETVHSQFGKTMLKMAGVQDNINSSLSYEDVSTILKSKLGNLIEIESLLKKEVDKLDDSDKASIKELLSQLMAEEEKLKTEAKEYTITDLDYLILWKDGDSLHPNIERRLEQLKDFVTESRKNNKDMYDQLHSFTNYKKIQMLIKANRYFSIRKEAWDYYIENINQSDLINVVIGILSVKAEEVNINNLCKAVVNNVDLLKRYML